MFLGLKLVLLQQLLCGCQLGTGVCQMGFTDSKLVFQHLGLTHHLEEGHNRYLVKQLTLIKFSVSESLACVRGTHKADRVADGLAYWHTGCC